MSRRDAVRRVLAGAVAAVLLLAGVTIAVAPSDPAPAPVAAADGARDALTGAVGRAREAVDRAVEAAEPVSLSFQGTEGVRVSVTFQRRDGEQVFASGALPLTGGVMPDDTEIVAIGYVEAGAVHPLACQVTRGGRVISSHVAPDTRSLAHCRIAP